MGVGPGTVEIVGFAQLPKAGRAILNLKPCLQLGAKR